MVTRDGLALRGESSGGNVALAELLFALSLVADTGMGQPMGHGIKTAYISSMVAERVGLASDDRVGVYYGALLKDAGCSACGTVLAAFFDGDDLGPRADAILVRPDSVKDVIAWFWRHASSDPALPTRLGRLCSFMTHCRGVMQESISAHCEVGEMFARRLGLPVAVQQAIRFSWERWDGKGMAYGLRGAHVPIAARVLHLAQLVQAAHTFGGPAAARALVTDRRGTDFDPNLVGPFLDLSESEGFWDILDSESAQDAVLALKPPCPWDRLEPSRVDAVCEVLADFADVKARSIWNHSLLVAETAAGVARRLGLPAAEAGRIRRAALVHDLGKAAVPVGILDKGEALTAEERDRFCLHPYYTERALSRIEPLRELAADAGAHHEHLDGSGYHRQLSRDRIPLGGRVLAVADQFSLRSRGPDGSDPSRALEDMRRLVGSQLDPDCYDALVASLGGGPLPRPGRPKVAGNLTDREVEVLRLLCEGGSNRDIAKILVVSSKTVEHHLEHIYGKLGVTSRTAASVFAVQNSLVS
ncbi:MAG: HD domain-containing protein [Chloroflexi bacterium]|nr:HD domain-containing protein [Chloroflexota bacterium]